MTVLEMPGLTAGPMGNWLAAVGALRMLSRADAGARLRWDGDVPVIATSLTAPERDIADRITFAPVITPWQSGGGWGPKDKGSAERLGLLRATSTPRLEPMRWAILLADQILAANPGEAKDVLVLALRNWLPDNSLPWLDAAVPLKSAGDGTPGVTVAWAPLAGTGGNDGRWDISTNYHAAILAIDPERSPEPGGGTADSAVIRRRGLLADLLYGTESERPCAMSGGPYWPGATETGLLNPWALILLAEGLCAFGDSPAAREFGVRRQPWTSSGGPELAEDDRPDEAWLPMWGNGATMAEVAHMLGGPQPRWRGRAARTAAEMYGALNTGGWPAGVTGYARYGLARRRGQGHVAVPLDMVTPATAPLLGEPLTGAQAAEIAGVGESTWRSYVARGQAPQPDAREMRTGQPGWLAGTVGAWLATRPGRGARTDRDN